MVTPTPLCEPCGRWPRGSAAAVVFVRERRWDGSLGEFVDAEVVPLCRECFDRRTLMWERTKSADRPPILWEDGLAEWLVQQVQES